MKHDEDNEQIALVTWCRLHPDPRIKKIYHPANGKKRGIVAATILKRMGVLAGVLDLHLPAASYIGGVWRHGLFIEMKNPNGKGVLSTAQEDMIDYLRSQDFEVVVCKNWIEGKRAIETYLGLKESK
jgi:hypothetical protein